MSMRPIVDRMDELAERIERIERMLGADGWERPGSLPACAHCRSRLIVVSGWNESGYGRALAGRKVVAGPFWRILPMPDGELRRQMYAYVEQESAT